MCLVKFENIIVWLRGMGIGKVVMVMGYYDSVLNFLGVGDDVYVVVNILEVVCIFVVEEWENDIIFLVIDGEEWGLFGVEVYVENYDFLEIGVLLNYEVRGNSG